MPTYVVDRVEGQFPGNQIIIWLADESSGKTSESDGTGSFCVRIVLPEAPLIIQALIEAHANTLQAVAEELAMGGCRTCANKRQVNGGPCPVCVPRGKERLRKLARMARVKPYVH